MKSFGVGWSASVALALMMSATEPAGAQWREPSGVTRPVTRAAFDLRGGAGDARQSSDSVWLPGLGQYVLVGAAVGVGAALLLEVVACCDDCMCGLGLPFTVPRGAAAGALGGLVVYGLTHLPGRRGSGALGEPGEVDEPGLARHMITGALLGGLVGVGTGGVNRCDDCTLSRAMVPHVPIGMAVGAAGGAIVHDLRQRRRARETRTEGGR